MIYEQKTSVCPVKTFRW